MRVTERVGRTEPASHDGNTRLAAVRKKLLPLIGFGLLSGLAGFLLSLVGAPRWLSLLTSRQSPSDHVGRLDLPPLWHRAGP